MPDAAREILIAGSHALAHAEGPSASLGALLDTLATQLGVGSGAIFVVARSGGGLDLAASYGLPDPARAGLVAAVADPRHPVARTASDAVPTFDVLPMAPGGPALRAHVPLTVTHDGGRLVLGVLALAYDQPIDAEMRPLVQATADLAAVVIERSRVAR